MKKYYSFTIALTTFLLLPVINGIAAGEDGVNGSVEIGVRGVDDKDRSAKLHEYRDLDDGVFGNIHLNYFTGSYYFGVKGKNIGQDDQFFMLKGGDYGQFKYKLLYDEIPHNLSFDARTF